MRTRTSASWPFDQFAFIEMASLYSSEALSISGRNLYLQNLRLIAYSLMDIWTKHWLFQRKIKSEIPYIYHAVQSVQ